MQDTSALWKELFAESLGTSYDVVFESKAVIGGVEYTEIGIPKISRGLTQNGLSVGNAVSASCQFSLRTSNTIARSASVVIQIRLNDGTQTSEWLTCGTFYIARRVRDPITGALSFECYDAMLKANTDVAVLTPWTDNNGNIIQTGNGEQFEFPSAYYPKPMAEVASDIADILGVSLDPRNVFKTGSAYVISRPDAGTTLRDLLCKIAAYNGANWVITPDNKLRLVPVISAAGAASAVDDVIDVYGIVGSINTGYSGTITGLRCDSEGDTFLTGTSSGIVVDIDAPVPVVLDIAEWMIGCTYQSYDIDGAIYDPAAEVGDYVRAGANGEIASVLYKEAVSVGKAYRGSISAPDSEELSDEYPYVGGVKKALQVSKAYTQQMVGSLDNSLDQESVFNRLTNNGTVQGMILLDGQLYINASYIRSGIINADLLRTGRITDSSGQNYWILNGDNSELVTRKGNIGDFTLANGSLQYGSLDQGGRGAYIGKDGIIFNITTNQGNTNKVRIYSQGLEFYWNNVLKTYLFIYQDGLTMRTYNPDGTYDHPIQVKDTEYPTFIFKAIYHYYDTRLMEKLFASKKATFYDGVEVHGDFQVYGTKNRLVDAGQYGQRLMYSYETPSPMFGDIGEGVIGDDGICYITLDAVFAQTIAETQYQVQLQKYGEGDCWVKERSGNYFVVQGTPGITFGWEIKAKQKGYDQRRLDRVANQAEPYENDYGDLAQQHIQKIHDGRISE